MVIVILIELIYVNLYLYFIESEIYHNASHLAMSSTFHTFLRDAEKLNDELKRNKRHDDYVYVLTELVKVSSKEKLN